ncbi:MAG: phosphatidylserine/phosphatidylglycerophosphate/cardiolipin synthase family protein [Leptospira sp.]|nr:phosphatidylserine/phosphatidylglycerophosphate/cardiolipin synthase family protein [Leptospira sp.]
MKTFLILEIIPVILQLFCNIHSRDQNRINELLLILPEDSSVKTYFSFPGRFSNPVDKENVQKRIIEIIRNTRSSLEIHLYSIDDQLIIQEILNAKKRGVAVSVTGDKDRDYGALSEKGIPVYIWQGSGLHHTKVIISDGRVVFTGTGNFTGGLVRDWNGYIEFRLEKNKSEDFAGFIKEKYEKPALRTNGLIFFSSPMNGIQIQNSILNEIEKSNTSIRYLIFDHYDPLITHALRKASARGVEVTGIYNDPVDPEGNYLSSSFFGLVSGIYRDGNDDILETGSFPEGGLLHHKTMIIDGRRLLSGSYNFSSSARDSNRELFFMTDLPETVNAFESEFFRIKEKSYKLNQRTFTSSYETGSDSVTLTGKDVCFSGNSPESPLLELGEGVFRTYVYFENNSRSRCFLKNSYESISSNFSNFKKNSFLDDPEFWTNATVYERNSDRKFLTGEGNQKSIYFLNNFGMIKPDFIDFHSGTRITFQTKSKLQNGSFVNLASPGSQIQRAPILQKFADDQTIFEVELKTNSNQRKNGIFFFPGAGKTDFFCYTDSLSGQDPSVINFIKNVQLEKILHSPGEETGQGCAVL